MMVSADEGLSSYYNRARAASLIEALEAGTILAQGPMGSILMGELGAEEVPPAFWNLAEPQAVRRIHQLYVAAGAQMLITNTFQASEPALERDAIGPAMAEVNRAAVDNARAAHAAIVVGSIGPCGVSWTIEDSPAYRRARAAYRDQARALLVAGVDAILLETFCSVRDLTPALAGVADASCGMPMLVSFSIDDAGTLLGDGLSIEAAVLLAEKSGAAAVGVNCCSIDAATCAVPRMVRAARTPVMVRPNAGDPERDEEGCLRWDEDPGAFAEASRAWREAGARVIGACCGTTPVTTAALADALL